MALAAAVLALAVLGGGAAFWIIHQRQMRLTGVEATLARIQSIRDQAAADGADPARWRDVLAAADAAIASIGDMAALEPGRRLASLRTKIAGDRAQAERDMKLIEELAGLRASVAKVSFESNPSLMERRFRRAFKRHGEDLEATPIGETVARLRTRPDAFVHEVIGSLDHWLTVRHDLAKSAENAREFLDLQRILELAQGLDSDPERNRLRAFLKNADLKTHLPVLGAMAQQSTFVEFGPSTVLLLARMFNRAGDAKSAVAVLRAAVVRYPGDVWTNTELATLLRQTQPSEFDEAIRYYTAARALRPETGLDLAYLLELAGRDHEAEAVNRELTRQNPKNVICLFTFLRSLRRNGKVDEARSVAQRITAPLRDKIGREPNNVSYRRELGQLLWVTGDAHAAITELREAVRIDSNDASSQQHLGLIFRRQDNLPAAIAAYRAATRIDPSDEDSHYHLASALELSGDREGQIAALREAIRAGRKCETERNNRCSPKARVPMSPS